MVMPRWGPALTKASWHCKELQWIISFLEFVSVSSGQAAWIEEVTSRLWLEEIFICTVESSHSQLVNYTSEEPQAYILRTRSALDIHSASVCPTDVLIPRWTGP